MKLKAMTNSLLFLFIFALSSAGCSTQQDISAAPAESPLDINCSDHIKSSYFSKIDDAIMHAILIAKQESIIEEKINAMPKYNYIYRDYMREWVMGISQTAKQQNPDFIIVPQNCLPLFTDSGYADGRYMHAFSDAIDGIGIESLSFGSQGINTARNEAERQKAVDMIARCQQNALSVFTIDYCNTAAASAVANEFAAYNGYVEFISPSYALSGIPTAYESINSDDITMLSDAKNWLCMLNPHQYSNKEAYINALCSADYDMIVIDAFFYGKGMLTAEDIQRLQRKSNGAKRLVISYLSIGEAEAYRYYWQKEYNQNPPEWLMAENPNWAGNFTVKYWDKEWQDIICYGEDSYLHQIIEAGFDGVYLDIVDGFERFENGE